MEELQETDNLKEGASEEPDLSDVNWDTIDGPNVWKEEDCINVFGEKEVYILQNKLLSMYLAWRCMEILGRIARLLQKVLEKLQGSRTCTP